jgi:hypothetical protein
LYIITVNVKGRIQFYQVNRMDRERIPDHVRYQPFETPIQILVFIPCILLYVHERPTNALILFKVYSLSYLLLHVLSSSMPSSGSLHVPTESSELSGEKCCPVH